MRSKKLEGAVLDNVQKAVKNVKDARINAEVAQVRLQDAAKSKRLLLESIYLTQYPKETISETEYIHFEEDTNSLEKRTIPNKDGAKPK